MDFEMLVRLGVLALSLAGAFVSLGYVLQTQKSNTGRLDGQARRQEAFEGRMRAVELSIAGLNTIPETLRRIENEIKSNDIEQGEARHALRNDVTKALESMNSRLDDLFKILAEKHFGS